MKVKSLADWDDFIIKKRCGLVGRVFNGEKYRRESKSLMLVRADEIAVELEKLLPYVNASDAVWIAHGGGITGEEKKKKKLKSIAELIKELRK